MAGLRARGWENPTLFSRSAPGSQHRLHAVAHRDEAGGVIRLALRNPNAVLIPVDIFDPHGKDLVRSHAAVLQNDHDQPSASCCRFSSPLIATGIARNRSPPSAASSGSTEN